jgi:type VI secretion system protein ImpH
MAQTDRRENPAIGDRLAERAWEFDFFQAVRLLEWMAWEAKSQGQPARAPVGEDARPDEELVRFRVPASTGFSSGAVESLRGPLASRADSPLAEREGHIPELTVSFLGLIGASGVLPHHYSTEAIGRLHEKDPALAEFFDIFQHRAVSLFFRAWRKYRLPFELERTLRDRLSKEAEPWQDDPFAVVLRGLVGLSAEAVSRRMHVADETVMYYAGHFTHQPRSALAFERMVGDYFGLPAEIEQFSGRWLTLPPDQRSTMPARDQPRGRNCALGRDTIVGSRVWDVHTKFRIRLGPMPYLRFAEFFPGASGLLELGDLARLYGGPALEFDVQPVLLRDEVPTAQLGEAKPTTMLGRNAWLAFRHRERDADEAVFRPM